MTPTWVNDTVVQSAFMAPAWWIASLGIQHARDDYLDLFISPITMKATFVLPPRLAYLRPAYGIALNQQAKYEAGAYGIAQFQKDLLKWLAFYSRLEVFMAYQNPSPDVNWENLLTLKFTKSIGLSYFVHLFYDTDVPGPESQPGQPNYVQVKTVLGLSVHWAY